MPASALSSKHAPPFNHPIRFSIWLTLFLELLAPCRWLTIPTLLTSLAHFQQTPSTRPAHGHKEIIQNPLLTLTTSTCSQLCSTFSKTTLVTLLAQISTSQPLPLVLTTMVGTTKSVMRWSCPLPRTVRLTCSTLSFGSQMTSSPLASLPTS